MVHTYIFVVDALQYMYNYGICYVLTVAIMLRRGYFWSFFQLGKGENFAVFYLKNTLDVL